MEGRAVKLRSLSEQLQEIGAFTSILLLRGDVSIFFTAALNREDDADAEGALCSMHWL